LTARVLLRRAAELDLAGIEDWYESQQVSLGAEFRQAVDELFRRIGDNPLAYPERYRANRRAFVRRFPYVVWYRLHGNDAVGLACVHGRRDPRLSRARLASGA
jgi:plasmid stabilization system protein ParE